MLRVLWKSVWIVCVLALISACSSEPTPASVNVIGPTPTAGSTPTTVPSPTPTRPPRFKGFDLSLEEGTFWTYRWQYETSSCAQGSGCRTRDDEGVMTIQLGSAQEVAGARLYPLEVSGKTRVTLDNQFRDFAPRWRYIGTNGDRITVSDGVATKTLFDARTGAWAGSGFFTDRFAGDELVTARQATIAGAFRFASWPGFRDGPAAMVSRAAGQSQCELIAGLRICPREETFNATEREFYRAGIGPLAYTYDFSASFSGGGFFSSNATLWAMS